MIRKFLVIGVGLVLTVALTGASLDCEGDSDCEVLCF
jgi:hypothetical protein